MSAAAPAPHAHPQPVEDGLSDKELDSMPINPDTGTTVDDSPATSDTAPTSGDQTRIRMCASRMVALHDEISESKRSVKAAQMEYKQCTETMKQFMSKRNISSIIVDHRHTVKTKKHKKMPTVNEQFVAESLVAFSKKHPDRMRPADCGSVANFIFDRRSSLAEDRWQTRIHAKKA
jgi:hypothetical protein